MAVTVRNSASSTSGSIVVPSTNISVGDLLVILTGNYANAITTPTGWTSAYSGSGTNTWVDYGQVFWKIAVSGDIGASVTLPSAQASYCGSVILVISGHDQTTPIVVNGNGGSGTSIISPSITTTKASREIALFTQMNNDGVTQTYSGLTSGWTSQYDFMGAASIYHRVMVAYKNTTSSAAGTLTGPTVTSNVNGGNVGVHLAINEGLSLPTTTITAPLDNTAFNNNTSSVNVTWTYADVESKAQTEYEISYRAKGSTGAYTTVGNTNANTSHTFSTGTFTNGMDYELRVRTRNAGGWGDYDTHYFTSGVSLWSYDTEVTTSSTTAQPLLVTYSQGFEADMDSWQSNPAFGVFTAASSLTRVNTKSDTGSWSLLVTCPAATSSAPTWANTILALQPNAVYEVTARVWVPTGVPPVQLENVFFVTSSQKSTTNNAWETIRATFVASSTGSNFVGVKVTGATTSGQTYYIDNMTVRQIELDGGTYELQVKSAPGDWSAIQTFVVNTPPTASSVDLNPKTIGGNVNVTWTYSDVNSDPQTKYQIRRRPH